MSTKGTLMSLRLKGKGISDDDLAAALHHMELALMRQGTSKAKGKKAKGAWTMDIDLSCNRALSDYGIIQHLAPFLQRWPRCRRLKLYKTAVGDATLQVLRDWASAGHAHELHLSHLTGQVSAKEVFAFLEAICGGGNYPYQAGEANCPLWLRLERNGLDPEALLSRSEAAGLAVRVVSSNELRRVRPGACRSPGVVPAASLVLFRNQGLGRKEMPEASRRESGSGAPKGGSRIVSRRWVQVDPGAQAAKTEAIAEEPHKAVPRAAAGVTEEQSAAGHNEGNCRVSTADAGAGIAEVTKRSSATARAEAGEASGRWRSRAVAATARSWPVLLGSGFHDRLDGVATQGGEIFGLGCDAGKCCKPPGKLAVRSVPEEVQGLAARPLGQAGDGSFYSTVPLSIPRVHGRRPASGTVSESSGADHYVEGGSSNSSTSAGAQTKKKHNKIHRPREVSDASLATPWPSNIFAAGQQECCGAPGLTEALMNPEAAEFKPMSPWRPTSIEEAAAWAAPKAAAPCGSQPAANLWRFTPAADRPLAIRAVPEINGPRTGYFLPPGEVFHVSEERIGSDGVRYLRIAGCGWAFDSRPDIGVICQPCRSPPPACDVAVHRDLQATMQWLRLHAQQAHSEVARLQTALRALANFALRDDGRLHGAIRSVVNNGWDNTTWHRGYTALHLAGELGSAEVVPLLLALRANPSAQDAKGRTAVDVARKRGHKEVIDALLPRHSSVLPQLNMDTQFT